MNQLGEHAKELLRAHEANDPAALERFAAVLPRGRIPLVLSDGRLVPRPKPPLTLSDAHLVIASEHGFPSWPKLQAYARRAERRGPELQHAFREDIEYYAERANGLLISAEDGAPGAVAAFERWQQ